MSLADSADERASPVRRQARSSTVEANRKRLEYIQRRPRFGLPSTLVRRPQTPQIGDDPVLQPFAAFIHRTKETDKLLETLDVGIRLLAQGPTVLRALRELDADEGRTPLSPKEAKQFLRLSARAKDVLRTRNAGLFSMALTQLWSQLEALIEDFVVGRFQEKPELARAADTRARVRLSEWLGLDDNQRCRQAVRDIIKNGTIGSLSDYRGR